MFSCGSDGGRTAVALAGRFPGGPAAAGSAMAAPAPRGRPTKAKGKSTQPTRRTSKGRNKPRANAKSPCGVDLSHKQQQPSKRQTKHRTARRAGHMHAFAAAPRLASCRTPRGFASAWRRVFSRAVTSFVLVAPRAFPHHAAACPPGMRCPFCGAARRPLRAPIATAQPTPGLPCSQS